MHLDAKHRHIDTQKERNSNRIYAIYPLSKGVQIVTVVSCLCWWPNYYYLVLSFSRFANNNDSVSCIQIKFCRTQQKFGFVDNTNKLVDFNKISGFFMKMMMIRRIDVSPVLTNYYCSIQRKSLTDRHMSNEKATSMHDCINSSHSILLDEERKKERIGIVFLANNSMTCNPFGALYMHLNSIMSLSM